ncbi:MAG TPA: RyR domain-containing protein, partial [Dehalococcoidales bacterium]|nr:RyR domain-containing protein [Dehalococcoidales bacterium]
ISRQISWERTAQDLVWELMYNPLISGLATFAYTVVSFDTAGAMLLSRKSGGTLEATLFFDPATMESEWARNYPGYMVGYTMMPARGKTAVAELSDDEVEVLARIEHERWMREKIDLGWKYADKTVKSRKKHNLLVPWDDLPMNEKKKDYVLVRGIPRILSRA